MKTPKSIRGYYEKLGVEDYYKRHAYDYSNPHFEQIRELLINNKDNIDYNNVLDFCAGAGEVTLVLQELGFDNALGCDPFTHKVYKRKTKRPCLRLDFKAVIRHQLEGDYSAIVCSFGMHLCPPKELYPLVFELFQHAPKLIIITPHKRPVLEELAGVQKTYEDFALTERGKKVRLKVYESGFIKRE